MYEIFQYVFFVYFSWIFSLQILTFVAEMETKSLIFATANELVRVQPSAVVYITADGNYSAITLADSSKYVLTLQLGQIERRIAESISADNNNFIRIGKSLIVNKRYIAYINPARQRLVLADGLSFRHEVTASREALRTLKDLVEQGDI